jgi:flagellar hook-associated protein 1 FlgK
MSNFSALHVALTGLRAAQLRMDTASHNVSNANTPGYTRQRVELAPRLPRTLPEGKVGTGVEITDIARIRDLFLDARYRSSASASGALDVRAEFLARAEGITGEPENGVTAELRALWDAFEDLALDPSDHAARIAVYEQLDAVAVRINDVAGGIEALRSEASANMEAAIGELNQGLQEIADLNVAILEAWTSGGTPSDLLDQRDRLVDRLSELAGVAVREEGNGSIAVSIGGISLVQGPHAKALAWDATTNQVLHPSGLAVVPGGEAGGYLQVITADLPALSADLDAFATALADALNTIHESGYTSSGPGGPLFTFNVADPAASLKVAISGPNGIATAASSGPPFAVYDATIVEQLAALRTAPAAAGGTMSLEAAMRGIITALGQETASARTGAETQQRLLEAAGQARDGMHGVSVDEEMVNLMEAQRMYEASARVITAVDQALDTLINRMGIVGR